MNNTEATDNAENDATRPRRSRQPKADRRVCIYRLIDGNWKEQGVFPEAVIGDPLERRLPTFLKDMFGTGEYKVDLRKANGHFEKSFPISIAESEPEHERVIDLEPEEFEEEPEAYSLNENGGNLTATEVENLLLKERLRRLEEDAQRNKSGSQGEMQTLISALEESRREQRELLLMMLQQAQKPQADAGTLAMGMMQQSLEMVKSAKSMAEEIAPGGSGEGSGGFLADGAKMIDSLGRAAPTFLPILAGLMPRSPQAPANPTFNEAPPFIPAPVENNGGGELAELAEKIHKKEAANK